MLKLTSFFTIALLSYFSLFGQNIILQWEGGKSYFDPVYSTDQFPYFSNEGYSVEEGVPVFSYSELNTLYTTVRVENLNWEAISKSELFQSPLYAIPTQEKVFAKIVKSRSQKNLWVRIVPFKYENNQLYRLKSFRIQKDNTPQNIEFSPINDFSDSVLKNGTYHKISVDTTGVYKLDYEFLSSSGLSPSSIDPDKIKIYGNGGAMLSETIDDFAYMDLQENAIEVVGGEDGSFDSGDYILFYAQGPHSFQRNNLLQPIHITNLYEDHAYYYIRTDGPNGLRVNEEVTNPTTNYLSEYDDYRVVEPEFYNINEVGRVWVGENFTLENTQSFTFDNLSISNTVPVRCQLSLFTQSAGGHGVQVNVNGNSVINSTVGSNQNYFQNTFNGNTTLTGNSLQIDITIDNAPNPIGISWLDYIELFFKQNLQYNGQQFNFRRLDNINNGNPYGFRINNAQNTKVWNVSEWVKPKKLVNHGSGGHFDFSYQSTSSDFRNEFVVFTPETAYTPEYVGLVKNQNLRGLDNIDYIVVTDNQFTSAAQNLTDFHESASDLNCATVTTEQIYNEFSSGSQDISAIRNFLRYLYNKSNTLKYLLILGDTSYDYKERIPNNSNIVPSYQSQSSVDLSNSYVTDDYYGILDDGEQGLSSTQLDLAIGRLPAAHVQEALTLVEKSLRYENAYPGQSSPFGIWRTKVKVVVDDDNSGDPFHETVEPNVSQHIESTEPQLNVRKLYLDAFNQVVTSGGERYPDVNEELDNSIESGALFVNYFGHGGPRSWAQERVFTEDQILGYQNMNTVFTRLPLFTTVTCDFSVWDNPNLNSAGEYLVKTDEGGGIASITTSRAIGVSYGKVFNARLVEQLFTEVGTSFKTFGEALMDAKISYPQGDNNKTNLLGDPAISLYRPPRAIDLLTINGEDANTYNSVFRALDFIEITGVVKNENNTATDTSFNGKAEIEIYDKKVEKSTLNNDNNLGVMDYEEQNTRIYSGSTEVVNGQFTFEFYIPKDIDYTVGNGKLVIYAENNETDGLYYKDDLLVGDINPDGIEDDEPPVARLFMNNRHFANGGITNKDPIFIACVTDSTGINSTGVGIGHDITLVLDGNINGTKVLNSFYQGGEQLDCPNPQLRDFQKGMVSYNLNNIEEGEHQITFKVWDINNNSTTETLDFIVVQEGDVGLVINRLLNWPNPFTDKTYFHFEHNCDDILEVQIQIFTISGKLVKNIRQQVTSEPYRKGYRTDKFGIPWDGLDEFGDKIGKGTYIFKATVRGSDTENCKGTATAIEKLVILK